MDNMHSKEKERGLRLNEARSMTGFSGMQFAKMHHIKYHTYNRWEKGQSNITTEIAKLCCEALLKNNVICSPEWLMLGEGTPPISLMSETSRLDNIRCAAEDLSIYSEIDFFKSANKNSIVVMIKDDAMLPFYNINDYVGGVFVEPRHIHQCHKRHCIVRLEQHLVVRTLYVINDKLCNLVCSNPLTNYINPITISISKAQPHIIIYHRQLLLT